MSRRNCDVSISCAPVKLYRVCLALLIVCAQISIPIWIVPITLQTLAVGLIATVLPLQLSSAVIAAYLLLGLVGLPVFANFAGGASVISDRQVVIYLALSSILASCIMACIILVVHARDV